MKRITLAFGLVLFMTQTVFAGTFTTRMETHYVDIDVGTPGEIRHYSGPLFVEDVEIGTGTALSVTLYTDDPATEELEWDRVWTFELNIDGVSLVVVRIANDADEPAAVVIDKATGQKLLDGELKYRYTRDWIQFDFIWADQG